MLITKPPQNPNKTIAYIRVSSQRQVDEGVSIGAQEDRIREYARFKGLDLDDADILVESGVSGGIPLWERPVGRNLKQKLMRGGFGHVITMKLDRMFRLVSDTLETVDELSDAGIALHIVDLHGEAVDTSSPMGTLGVRCSLSSFRF